MAFFFLCLLLVATLASAETQKVIFDTDIGDDVDDAYALAVLLQVPDVRLLGVTTAFGDTAKRAEIAAKFLQEYGKGDIPVYAGRSTPREMLGQYEWAKGFKSKAIKTQTAVEFMKREVEHSPGKVTIIAVGPLTNVGDLLTQYPDIKKKIGRVVIMGGSVYVGYNNLPPINPEWNIKCDPAAARTLFDSGVSVVVAGLEVTTMMKLDDALQKRLYDYKTHGTEMLMELTRLWGNKVPTLFDPMAVTYALGFKFCEEEQVRLEVDDKGFTYAKDGFPKVTLLVKPNKKAFLDWYLSIFAPKDTPTYRNAIAIRQP